VLRNISWKALPISNAIYFAAGFAVLFLLLLVAELVAYVRDPAVSLHASAHAVGSSPVTALLTIACTSLAAGYVGGRIAKRQYVLNGALGTAVPAVWSFCELAFGPLLGPSDGPAWLETMSNVLTVFAGPLLGGYGGHLAELHQLRLDAMTAEERQARNFQFYAVVVIRWIAACAVAAVMYFGVFGIGVYAFGFFRWLPVLAAMSAIMAASFVFPSQHRSAGCLLLVALVIAVPMAVLIGHVSAGDANYGHSFLVVYNAVGALLSYQACAQGRSRHWWWLSTRNFAGFSKTQRTARIYLMLIGFTVGVLLYLGVLAVANGIGVDPHLAIVSFVITVPIGFIAARPLCGMLWPDVLEQADYDARLNPGRLQTTFD
jgi:hypothetical protein